MQPETFDDNTDEAEPGADAATGAAAQRAPVTADHDAPAGSVKPEAEAAPENEGDAPPEDAAADKSASGSAPALAEPAEPAAPAEPPWTPKPREPIAPQRGINSWHTHGLRIERAKGTAFHAHIESHGAVHVIYLSRHNVDRMLDLATAPNTESGKLWAYLASVPLERLMPSRQLEEELKALLLAFASELRG